jgi:hypothetical protein
MPSLVLSDSIIQLPAPWLLRMAAARAQIPAFANAPRDSSGTRCAKRAYCVAASPNPMTPSIALFHFRLSGGHGIGRAELLALWSAACRSSSVDVRRTRSGNVVGSAAYTYSLFGPAKHLDTHEVELRMRQALEKALPKAGIVLSRY